MCILKIVSYLLSLRAVSPDEVLAQSSLAGHIDMAVGTATVVTYTLQEVRTHRHLEREREVGVTDLCLAISPYKCHTNKAFSMELNI